MLEFIARLIMHIPDFHERQVVYYGAYGNASGIRQQHRRARQEGDGPALWMSPEEEPTPFERRRRIRWQQLIAKVYLENPLLCPECGQGMQIISFITDPPVVDKILRHLNHKRRERTRRSPRGGRMPGLLIAGPRQALLVPLNPG